MHLNDFISLCKNAKVSVTIAPEGLVLFDDVSDFQMEVPYSKLDAVKELLVSRERSNRLAEILGTWV